MNVLSENIRSYRKERGLTITDLADIANLSAAGISQIENGKRDASFKTISKIAQALNVDVPTLVTPLNNQYTHHLKTIVNFADDKKMIIGTSTSTFNKHVHWSGIFDISENAEVVEIISLKTDIEKHISFEKFFSKDLQVFLTEQQQQILLRKDLEIQKSYKQAVKDGIDWETLESLIFQVVIDNN